MATVNKKSQISQFERVSAWYVFSFLSKYEKLVWKEKVN